MSTLYRIHWTPGTDRLVAVCHCASWCEVDDPVRAWEWLLAHPVGHDPTAAPYPGDCGAPPDDPGAVPSHLPAAGGFPRP